MNVLHIFGQEALHDEVYIVGNKSALERLRNIIDMAIADDYDSVDGFYASDGEGYGISIL